MVLESCDVFYKQHATQLVDGIKFEPIIIFFYCYGFSDNAWEINTKTAIIEYFIAHTLQFSSLLF